MRTASYGRFLFGASAALFGVIALMWHDDDTWQSTAALWRLPWGAVFGQSLMAIQIAGGFGLMYARTLRLASVILGIVYAIFTLACIPGILAAPRTFGAYDGLFEQLALLCGAVAAYVVARGRETTLARWAAFGLGLCAISFGLAQIWYFRFTASLVPAWMPPSRGFWAIVTTAAFFLAAIALLTGCRARLAAGLLALMVVLFGALVWIPMLAGHPHAHGDWSEFALTLLIAGAGWTLADSLRLPALLS